MAQRIRALRPAGASSVCAAVDAFLSSPRVANPNTRRAYAGALDRVLDELGPAADLAELSGEQHAEAMERLWDIARRRPGTATVLRSPLGSPGAATPDWSARYCLRPANAVARPPTPRAR